MSSRADRLRYGDTGTEVERGRKSVEMKVESKRVCAIVVVRKDECLLSRATLIGHYLR